MPDMKRVTASSWAGKSVSSRWVSTASGFVTTFCADAAVKAQLTSGTGRRRGRGRRGCIAPRPCVRLSSGRTVATRGTLVTSTGEPITVSEAMGRSPRSAATRSAKIPPRLHPDDVHGPSAGVPCAARIASGSTSSTQCSTPTPGSERHLPVLDQVGRPPCVTRCSTSEQPRAGRSRGRARRAA